MLLKKIFQNAMRFLGSIFLAGIITALCRTLRINIKNTEALNKLEKKNYLFVFWHGAMLLPWYVGRDKKIAALVSQSKDGELLVGVLEKWNYQIVRGSSSSRGSQALNDILELLNSNNIAAITPDGPKGPARKFKAGAVVAAKKCGVPLVMVGAAAEKKRRLHSWDKFEIPLPFSRVNIVYSDPVYVDAVLTYEGTSEKINECENLLNILQSEAEKF